jgi:3-methyladenine DNA glycosylase AlkD
MPMDEHEVLQTLRTFSRPENVAGMARFGIAPTNNLGISIVTLRKYAKKIGTDHALALSLWDSGIHEARLLATMIDDPTLVTKQQMDHWASQFDSWDVCDQCCNNLFYKTPYAYEKVHHWCTKEKEYVKRAGFTLVAVLAVHDKKASDEQFLNFFPLIKQQATDNRNYVKKAVNWALRQIGKRNTTLNKKALALAYDLKQSDSPAARWIATDAIRELTSEKIRNSLTIKKKRTKTKRKP